MVSPYYILTIGLGLGFLLGLGGGKLKKVNAALVSVALFSFFAISMSWTYGFISGTYVETAFYSAGFNPPFSIALQVGMNEAIFSVLINLIGVLSALYLYRNFSTASSRLGPVMLILIMALNMLVFTRDIFNIFVFLEITSISVSGMVLLNRSHSAHASGFKYLLASSLISSFYLLGVVMVYFFSGTLYLNELAGFGASALPAAGFSVMLMLLGLILELKPFPANGWALDVYEGTHPANGALLSGAIATAVLFVLDKVMSMSSPAMQMMTVVVGAVTFLFSNWMGIAQKNAQRLLGYSSIGQIGLIVAVIGLQGYIGDSYKMIAFGLLVTHLLAKSGLFWITGLINGTSLQSFTVLRRKPVLLVLFGIFIFALSAFPPFPGFFAKWELMLSLAQGGNYGWMAMILLGSMFEVIYLFRWFGMAVKEEMTQEAEGLKIPTGSWIAVILPGALLFAAGYFSTPFLRVQEVWNYIPLLAVAALYFIDFLPAWVKNTLLIAATGFYGYLVLPTMRDFSLIFGLIFIIGAILTLLYGYSEKGRRPGFYPLVAMMFAGLMLLVEARSLPTFFFAWEIMTAGSYFLILRGKKSQPHALSYMLFSFGGALLILAGFAIAYATTSTLTFDALLMQSTLSPLVFIMLTLGFLTKTAAIGLHIWLPGAHSEAEADVSPMVSGILLKAGVFGLILLFMRMGHQYVLGVDLMWILSWVGVITAIGGNLLASMQEDMKRLLAYSSVGQLGYILFGLSLMSNLGWLLAISGAIMHFLYKTMLFQAVGGVYSRTHDRMMYRMGGLIFRMPLTFIVVLIGIIALSGVPPLAGFSGKWISFNAVLQKGYYLQGAAMILAGAVAFLYLFRLIHAPFLGQLKDHLRKVKEASFWILLPQYLIILFIMAVSTIPGLLLERIGNMLHSIFPTGGLTWVESALPFGARTAISQYGYWNGTYVMVVTVAVFAILLGVQLLIQRRNKKVGQFNIVYSAERPSTPETTHHAYNFYAHYQKAVGFLITPWATRFWNWVSAMVQDIAHQIRQIYNGSAQAYLMHIIAFVLVCYFIIYGGK